MVNQDSKNEPKNEPNGTFEEFQIKTSILELEPRGMATIGSTSLGQKELKSVLFSLVIRVMQAENFLRHALYMALATSLLFWNKWLSIPANQIMIIYSPFSLSIQTLQQSYPWLPKYYTTCKVVEYQFEYLQNRFTVVSHENLSLKVILGFYGDSKLVLQEEKD